MKEFPKLVIELDGKEYVITNARELLNFAIVQLESYLDKKVSTNPEFTGSELSYYRAISLEDDRTVEEFFIEKWKMKDVGYHASNKEIYSILKDRGSIKCVSANPV